MPKNLCDKVKNRNEILMNKYIYTKIMQTTTENHSLKKKHNLHSHPYVPFSELTFIEVLFFLFRFDFTTLHLTIYSGPYIRNFSI